MRVCDVLHLFTSAITAHIVNKIFEMADEFDKVGMYNEDDDFPEYANEQNIELNQIVRSTFVFNYKR